MKQQDLDRFITESVEDYNAPPTPPREAMWSAIRESRSAGVPAGPRAGRTPVRDPIAARPPGRERRGRWRRWTPWTVALAAAAMLAIGFGLGRATLDRMPEPAATAAADAETTSPSLPVRLATATHMGEAEALLTLFRTPELRTDDRMDTARWASDLLGTTRMLLDSRVAEDPDVAMLLADLELVLVQIASTGVMDATEQELIEAGIEERQLLAKLRAAAETPSEMAM